MSRSGVRAWVLAIGLAIASACGLLAGACDRATQTAGTGAPAVARTYKVGDPSRPTLTVALTLDRTEITPADSLTLTLIGATDGSAGEVVMPEVGEQLGEFTVASSQMQPRGPAPIDVTRRLTLVLEPFLPGTHTIPPLEVTLRGSGGQGGARVKTEPIPVEVRSLIPPSRAQVELRPAKPPESIGEGFSQRGWGALGAASVATLLWSGVWLWAWVSGRATRGIVVNAAEAARLELDGIGNELEAGRPTAEVCARLSACVRRFVQRRFGVPAVTWSAEQISRATWARSRLVRDSDRAELVSLLSALDRIRFMPAEPERPNVRVLIVRARTWIDVVAPSDEVIPTDVKGAAA